MSIIDALIRRGVKIPAPHAIEIGEDISAERISPEDVIIHPGSRLSGASTYIGSGARIGSEGPASVHNCQIGPDVELKSGHFENAVFLEGASLGYGSHVRGGTILEEQASIAHCVGLKQTILFPFVTLGSLINFCDGLMAGGTRRENHSEIGSSFIHFNYTPNQDKATASLIGDVPKGVMLTQDPIFLGGQGGVVGPCRIAYGTISAAGTIVRKDQLEPGHLIWGGAGKGGRMPWKPGGFGGSRRIIQNNLYYIGNLFALRTWYDQVRRRFVGTRFPEALLAGLIEIVDKGLDERVKRLRLYIERLANEKVSKAWEPFEKNCQDRSRERGRHTSRDVFLDQLSPVQTQNESYLKAIMALPPATAARGSQWLAGIVDEIVENGSRIIT